jgi:hypothetical protein
LFLAIISPAAAAAAGAAGITPSILKIAPGPGDPRDIYKRTASGDVPRDASEVSATSNKIIIILLL